MKRVHRKHSADFKSKVAIEALKEQKTLSQISEQYALPSSSNEHGATQSRNISTFMHTN